MVTKILVVEDNKTLQETLEYNLKRQGYEVTVAGNGRSAVELAKSIQPNLIVLDVMLPEFDGFEVCRRVRQEQNMPILMLTARADEIDKIVGLEMGADDYLTKPFSMRELLARVKAMLRRVDLVRQDVAAEHQKSQATAPVSKNSRLVFGNLIIDQGRHELFLNGKSLRLKPKEYELLTFLARHKGIAVSRSSLLERVWGWSYDGNSRTVDVHVRWLREKIEPEDGKASRIVTVRGVGYRFDG